MVIYPGHQQKKKKSRVTTRHLRPAGAVVQSGKSKGGGGNGGHMNGDRVIKFWPGPSKKGQGNTRDSGNRQRGRLVEKKMEPLPTVNKMDGN